MRCVNVVGEEGENERTSVSSLFEIYCSILPSSTPEHRQQQGLAEYNYVIRIVFQSLLPHKQGLIYTRRALIIFRRWVSLRLSLFVEVRGVFPRERFIASPFSSPRAERNPLQMDARLRLCGCTGWNINVNHRFAMFPWRGCAQGVKLAMGASSSHAALHRVRSQCLQTSDYFVSNGSSNKFLLLPRFFCASFFKNILEILKSLEGIFLS